MTNPSFSWERYRDDELSVITPMLTRLGYALDAEQPHLGGERTVISGKKLVLLGQRASDQARVVIKASSQEEGKREMRLENSCREVLNRLPFASDIFLSPKLLTWHEEGACLIAVTEFLHQNPSFLERSFQEQFFLTIKAFETQEGAHATTFEHGREIRSAFRVFEPETYLLQLKEYGTFVSAHPETTGRIRSLFARAEALLSENEPRLRQYGGFLTHGDFVPHNVRLVGHDIYFLDLYDIRFGNKYDGWARFLNFMLLYHRELEQACLQYLSHNRASEELEALHLMRVYRLGELVWYYTRRLQKSTGDLQVLDRERVRFWADVLEATLDNTSVSTARIAAYRATRDQLRSEDEKARQKGLH